MNFLKRLFLAIFRKDKSKEKKISIKLNRKKITSKSDAENLQNIEFAKTEYSTPKENEKNKAFIIREESNSYKPIQSVISDFPSKKLSPIKILDFKSPNEIHKNTWVLISYFARKDIRCLKKNLVPLKWM
ncbi:hypothetical protein FJZ21_01900 [Candidatus Pacearchaeota archaeon]|nr:hypothetical protein [Candidatus Pacearchaeota archaeon]